MKLQRILLLLLLPFLLSLPACSDSDNDNGLSDPDINADLTDGICAVWRITEWESYDKSYFTKDFETSWFICSREGERNNASYRLTQQPEIHFDEGIGVYTIGGRHYIAYSRDDTPLFEIEDFTALSYKRIMILLDRDGNRYRCETVEDPVVIYLRNDAFREGVSVRYTSYYALGSHDTKYGETTLDYTVADLPYDLDAAYAVLIQPYSDSRMYTNVVTCNVTSPDNRTVEYSFYPGPGFNRGLIKEKDFVGVEPSPTPGETTDNYYEELQKVGLYFLKDNPDAKLSQSVLYVQKYITDISDESARIFGGFAKIGKTLSLASINEDYLEFETIEKKSNGDFSAILKPNGTMGTTGRTNLDNNLYWLEIRATEKGETMLYGTKITSVTLVGDFNNWNPKDPEYTLAASDIKDFYDGADVDYYWNIPITALNSGVKLIANRTWKLSWGSTGKKGMMRLYLNGNNIYPSDRAPVNTNYYQIGINWQGGSMDIR